VDKNSSISFANSLIPFGLARPERIDPPLVPRNQFPSLARQCSIVYFCLGNNKIELFSSLVLPSCSACPCSLGACPACPGCSCQGYYRGRDRRVEILLPRQFRVLSMGLTIRAWGRAPHLFLHHVKKGDFNSMSTFSLILPPLKPSGSLKFPPLWQEPSFFAKKSPFFFKNFSGFKS
jgi:hypothetical protein